MVLWIATAIAVAVGLSAGLLTIRVATRLRLGIDHGDADYKAHCHEVPRLGGIAVFAALSCALGFVGWQLEEMADETVLLMLSLLPALLIGLIEDFLQRVGTLIRLAVTMTAAGLGWWLLDARLVALELPAIDGVLSTYALASLGFTAFAAAGVSHSINIIDGCNGLSAFIVIVILASLAAVASVVGDQFVFIVALLGAASILGFFFLNFPFGRIFMGDGGAYFSGLLIALLSVLLTRRNPDVSPWFPLLVCLYPVWETLFSAYRRMVVRGCSPGSADRLHLHNLVYYRLVRIFPRARNARQQALHSSIAAIYLWPLPVICAIPALLFWDQGAWLKLFSGLFVLSYGIAYAVLVRFRSPKMLVLQRRRPPLLRNREGAYGSGKA